MNSYIWAKAHATSAYSHFMVDILGSISASVLLATLFQMEHKATPDGWIAVHDFEFWDCARLGKWEFELAKQVLLDLSILEEIPSSCRAPGYYRLCPTAIERLFCIESFHEIAKPLHGSFNGLSEITVGLPLTLDSPIRKKPNPAPNGASSPVKPGRFDDFWSVYPRKTAKKEALKAWLKHNCADVAEQIIARVKVAPELKTEKCFIPYPSTWLNQRRWEDELEAIQPLKSLEEIAAEYDAEQRAEKELYELT